MLNATNCYVCKTCNGKISTRDIDEGTTPFGIACKMEGCKGIMYSRFYRPMEGDPPVTFEWYRRRWQWFMSRMERDHHDKGGLFLRPAQVDMAAKAIEAAEGFRRGK